MKGSYLPIVSLSFKNVASSIVSFKIQFLLISGFGSESGGAMMNCVVTTISPVFFSFLSKSTKLWVFKVSSSVSIKNDSGLVFPKLSEDAMSLSNVSKTSGLPELTYSKMLVRQNFWFQAACFPASSKTSVDTVVP